MKRRVLAILMSLSLIPGLLACGKSAPTVQITEEQAAQVMSHFPAESVDKSEMDLASMTPEEIVALLTLDEIAAQMVQPACYYVTRSQMETYDYGSILSQSDYLTAEEWRSYIVDMQSAALSSPAGIPYVYGQDDVHGVNYCNGAVIFPQNIGIGAANDPELTYQMGLAVADEAKLCGMLWNFAPCVAVATEPCWGRTYESYSSEVPIVTELSSSYVQGLLDGGIIACPKHFFADGNVGYGTGEGDNLIDRGDATLTDAQIEELLSVYQALIDLGAQTIMISHSSVNGVKMHENEEYIMKLKNEMGFTGFIVSDWESIHNITGNSLDEQVVTAINSGIDMLMEPEQYEQCRTIIVQAVKDGRIAPERVIDAATRIIRVKQNTGIFEDPMMEHLDTVQTTTGSEEYRALAEQLVEESLVLIKNDNGVLPLEDGMSIYLSGPAMDSSGLQCGGWTKEWNGDSNITGCTTILQGFEDIAEEHNLTIITDPNQAANADVTILCVAESTYAEWNGDTEDMSITGSVAHPDNQEAIEEAAQLRADNNIPTVTCIVAGREVIIEEYMDQWDGIVMCYLPGSEAQGISHVLIGDSEFQGTLPMPWYSSVDQIGTEECRFAVGYGLTY